MPGSGLNGREAVLITHDLDSRLVALQQRLTLKLGSMLVVATGMVAALVKLLCEDRAL